MKDFLKFAIPIFLAVLTVIVIYVFGLQITVILLIAPLGHLFSTMGLPENLAWALVLPYAVILTYVLKYVFSTDEDKVLIGLIAACFLWVGWFGTQYYLHKNDNFDSTGKAITCITAYPDGYKVSKSKCENGEPDPITGNEAFPIPKELIGEYLDSNGYMQLKEIQLTPETKFFTINGLPRIWYYRDSEGQIHLYNLPGVEPFTKKRLLPITEEVAEELRALLKKKTATAEATRLEAERISKENAAAEAQNQLNLQQKQEAEAQRLKAEEEAKALQQQNAELQAKLNPPRPNNLGTNYITATCTPPLKQVFTNNQTERLSCCEAPSGEQVNCVIPNLPNFCARKLREGEPAIDLGENCCRNDQEQGCYSLLNGHATYTEIPNAKLPRFCSSHSIFIYNYGYDTNSAPAPDLGPNCCRGDRTQGCFTISKGNKAEFKEIPREVRQSTATPQPIPTARTQDDGYTYGPTAPNLPNQNSAGISNDTKIFGAGDGSNTIDFQFDSMVTEYYVSFYKEKLFQKRELSPTQKVQFNGALSGIQYVNFKSDKLGWLVSGDYVLRFSLRYRINNGSWVQATPADIVCLQGTWWNVKIIIP